MVDRVLLLSYGKTKSGARPDALKTSAKRQAQKLGVYMQACGWHPDMTIAPVDGAARGSAEKALKAGGWSALDIVAGQIRDMSQLGAVVGPEVRCVLCSGSAGAMSALLQRMIGGVINLPRGSLACVTMQHGRGQLSQVISADTLPDGFPYPGPGSAVRRDRPAYYYRQSAALPYRDRGQGPEVLVITSSSGRKWGIPKGICEPGLSPQASAAQEAFEEAGIRGDIDAVATAQYQAAKWGATCDIAVYPMRVTQVLPDDAWDECHRQRAWLAPNAAADRVSDPALARIIDAWAAGYPTQTSG